MNSIKDISFEQKKVLIRVDFNVPINDKDEVTDNSRIKSSIPTIKHVLDQGGSCILVSHLGRPKGVDPQFSLKKIIPELENLLNLRVKFISDFFEIKDKHQELDLKKGEVALLENLRFNPEETAADEAFAKRLSTLADIYINDAFGTTHREHASTATVAKFFEIKCAGLLLQREIDSLQKLLKNPKRPVTAIIGGAKVSSKLSVIVNMLNVVDNLIIGGGMAYTFIKNNGGSIGDSIFEKDCLNDCTKIIEQARNKGVNIYLPTDVIASNEFSDTSLKKEINIYEIPEGWQGLDIGTKTRNEFEKIIFLSKTILWNGPMGVFEMSSFEHGTKEVAIAVGKATAQGAFSLVGGGDSVAAIKKFKLEQSISCISTGGGAMLESLEGKVLPGIKALL
jgi:phosphoglycerate kinase